MTILFDPELHQYTLDGSIVPSVSKIIAPAYGELRFVKAEDLKRASALGKKVHRTIELFELGRLDRANLDPFLELHLVQWLRFKEDVDWNDEAGEEFVASRKYQYCGTLDRRGRCRLAGMGRQCLLDIKTGGVFGAHKLQTAGYKLAGEEMGIIEHDAIRSSIYIDTKGYDLQFHPRDVADMPAFLGLRTFLKWEQTTK